MKTSMVMEAPVERVFAFLAEPDNRPLWQSSLRKVERFTEGPPRVGTRWREKPLELAWVPMEIIELDENRVWAERAQMPFGVFTLRLRFTPLERRTRVDVEADLDLRGPAKILGLGAKLVMPRAFESDLRRAERIIRTSL